MARVNTDILGISELKWTGMGEINSEDHYIYYCGQESLRRNGGAIMVNKRIGNAVLGCNLKSDRMISIRFQGKPFNITVIQVYALTTSAKEAEVEQFCDNLLNMPANLENSAVAIRLEKVSFHSNPKEGNAKECSNYALLHSFHMLAK